MFRNILVPTDGSALSRKAVKFAVRLAKEQRARVTGIYVAPPWKPNIIDDASAAGFVSPAQYAASVKRTAERHLDAVKRGAAAAGVTARCLNTTGEYAYEAIVKAAKENRCDLICMASHGRRGISRLLLGSETSKVLAHSPVPVLVVK
ncbi:MAG: universal stress protein [Burkholderiales bacterium]|nr:universal stress protein [Burkholderiales bacterium]